MLETLLLLTLIATTYHLQKNRQTKLTDLCFKTFLHCFVVDQPLNFGVVVSMAIILLQYHISCLNSYHSLRDYL